MARSTAAIGAPRALACGKSKSSLSAAASGVLAASCRAGFAADCARAATVVAAVSAAPQKSVTIRLRVVLSYGMFFFFKQKTAYEIVAFPSPVSVIDALRVARFDDS